MKIKKQPWALAIIYVIVSLAIEAAAMVIGHLKPPQDNAVLAPIVLTIPPLVAAWLCGYRRPRMLIWTAILLSVLTLLLTAIAGRLTGISTGMVEPILNRVLVGFLAGLIANRWIARAPERDGT